MRQNDIKRLIAEVPPEFPLDVACEAIPMRSTAALSAFLNQHKDLFPARYRKGAGSHPPLRFLNIDEIKLVRHLRTVTKDKTGYGRVGRKPRAKGPISLLIERAFKNA
jgi:hypothetical protein